MKPPEGSTLITRAVFSPDGRWLAYTAILSDGSFVYVSPFPVGSGGHRKIMNEPAGALIWSRDGREIFVNALGTLQVLGMTTQPALNWTNPKELFVVQGVWAPGGGSTNYDVTRDGKQLLLIVPDMTQGSITAPEIQIVLNWHEELKRLAPMQ